MEINNTYEDCTKEELLEKVLEYEKQLNGGSDLIRELNLMASLFAEELKKIRLGEGFYESDEEGKTSSGLILLSGDAKDKTFERIIVLFDKIDKIKALASMTFDSSKNGVEKAPKSLQDFALKK